MDKLSIMKSRIEQSSNAGAFNNIKDHVLSLIFKDLSLDDAISYPIYRLIEIKNKYIKSQTSKPLSCISLEYYTIRGWEENEAKDVIKSIQSKNGFKFSAKRKEDPDRYAHIKSPMTIDFWTEKGLSIEEAKLQIKSQRPHSVTHWLNKGYSINEAKAMANNHQHVANKSFLDKLRDDPESYNGFSNTQLQYWLNLGYDEIEAAHILKDRQATFSLDKCIAKYGEIEGMERFNKRQDTWKKSLYENFIKHGDGRSPSSQFAAEVINAICSKLDIQVPLKEKYIRDEISGKAYSYDFTLNLRDRKRIIEFNGDYWHCNPLFYEADHFNSSKQMTAIEIWNYDKEKIELAKRKGYKVHVVWESDWKTSHDAVILHCLDFLNN